MLTSGIKAGWTPDNNSAIGGGTAHGIASPFNRSTVTVPAGSSRKLRVDTTPGDTYGIKLLTYMPDPTYLSTALRILQSDGSTVAFAQNGGTVVTRSSDSVGNKQCNTDGSLQSVAAADAGTSVVPTGSYIDIEWTGAGSFASRLTYIELTYSGGGGGITALLLNLLRRRRLF